MFMSEDKVDMASGIAMDLTQKTTLPQAEYDVAICAGIFGSGHLSANHTRELIRVVKSGGYLINLMNAMPYEDENFANFYNKFSEEGLWQILSNTTVNYMDELERPGRLIVARIHS
jgi:hypothetical protein